ERERPDLVLMDVRLLGDRDGIDAATEIWQRFAIRSLLVSANLDTAARSKASAANPIGFLEKPYSPTSLLAAVEAQPYRPYPAPRWPVPPTIPQWPGPRGLSLDRAFDPRPHRRQSAIRAPRGAPQVSPSSVRQRFDLYPVEPYSREHRSGVLTQRRGA